MLSISLASVLLALGAAGAPPQPDQLTLDQAVRRVQQKTGGRVLSADKVRSGHASRYRIKTLLDNGRVRVIEVDSDPDKKMHNLPKRKPTKEAADANPAG